MPSRAETYHVFLKTIACLCFLFLFMSLFLAVDACLNWRLPSITEQQFSPHRLPMQYWLKNQAFFKLSQHTNSISNSAILCNNYISLPKVICAHAYTWRKIGITKEAIVLQWAVRTALWDFKPGKKAMGWCTAQWKMLFCAKTIVKVMQIWTSPSEEEERKTFWPSGDFLVRYFRNAF